MKFLNSLRALVLLAILLVFSEGVLAKDLHERLGLGFKNNTALSLPSIAVVYYAVKDFAFTGGAGINTEKDYSAYQVHAGMRKIIFMENNLNFYTGAQLGLSSFETPTSGRNSGVEILAVLGAEFFLSGLENLAFTFESGVGISSVKDTRFRTVGDDPFRAGVIFYF
ncbi:MAG: organic solvent tolerance protein [Bdellovibrio sp.]|nr:organic solvent tolerance protein [Bdellovibrio sp.]